MKKLILISALLFSFNGWAYVDFSNCIDTKKITNHGYREIQKISDYLGNIDYNSGCRKGRHLTFSSGEVFECMQDIFVSKGERIVLYSSLLEGIFLNPKMYENGQLPCAAKPETQTLMLISFLTIFEENKDNFKKPLSFIGSEDYRETFLLVREDNQTYGLQKILSKGVPGVIENLYFEDSDGKLVIYLYDSFPSSDPDTNSHTSPELIILNNNDSKAIKIKEIFRSGL
jgi:hypothetical protein